MTAPEPPVAAAQRLGHLEAALTAVIRGKPEVIRLSVVCLLSRGHLSRAEQK
jgi:hypothetical protein